VRRAGAGSSWCTRGDTNETTRATWAPNTQRTKKADGPPPRHKHPPLFKIHNCILLYSKVPMTYAASAAAGFERCSIYPAENMTTIPWLSLHLENLGVPLFDGIRLCKDAFGILLHQLDVGEFTDARLFNSLGVRRILAGVIDDQLLALARVHPALKQTSSVWIGSGLEDRTWTAGKRRSLLRVNNVDRLACFLVADDKVARAVDHDRAFAKRNSLRRIGR